MLEILPTVNALLNGLAFVLLLAGWMAIRRKNIRAHRAYMISAFFTSAMFLACYLYYHFGVQRTKPYGGTGVMQVVYKAVLYPHIILAMVMLPMIIETFRRALTGRFHAHKRIARWTLPIWLYVSFTGVVVYTMLYLANPAP